MEFLYNKTPQVDSDNIHALILAGMLTNEVELVQVNGYDAISANDETANNFYIVCFTSVPYTLQEDVESDVNQLESGDPVCNAIYASTGRHKP